MDQQKEKLNSLKSRHLSQKASTAVQLLLLFCLFLLPERAHADCVFGCYGGGGDHECCDSAAEAAAWIATHAPGACNVSTVPANFQGCASSGDVNYGQPGPNDTCPGIGFVFYCTPAQCSGTTPPQPCTATGPDGNQCPGTKTCSGGLWGDCQPGPTCDPCVNNPCLCDPCCTNPTPCCYHPDDPACHNNCAPGDTCCIDPSSCTCSSAPEGSGGFLR